MGSFWRPKTGRERRLAVAQGLQLRLRLGRPLLWLLEKFLQFNVKVQSAVISVTHLNS
jgi:hypothetical protein